MQEMAEKKSPLSLSKKLQSNYEKCRQLLKSQLAFGFFSFVKCVEGETELNAIDGILGFVSIQDLWMEKTKAFVL